MLNAMCTSGTSPTRPVDFSVRCEGSLYLFTPLSPAASDFLSEFIQDEAIYWGPSLVVEHRFAGDLLMDLREHNLSAVRQ
jgi:hypothetical protein